MKSLLSDLSTLYYICQIEQYFEQIYQALSHITQSKDQQEGWIYVVVSISVSTSVRVFSKNVQYVFWTNVADIFVS